jgi:hypothetical protein
MGDGVNFFIGDNGGDEQTVDLAATGLSGTIAQVAIESYTLGSEKQIIVDYIDFIEP